MNVAPGGSLAQAAVIRRRCAGLVSPAMEKARVRGVVQGVVAQGLDGALGYDQSAVLRGRYRVPQALACPPGEALEARVAELKAAQAVTVVVREDGVVIPVGIDLPRKIGSARTAAGMLCSCSR